MIQDVDLAALATDDHVLKAVHGEEVPDLHAEVIERDRPRWLRTRSHVAMLGLLHPAFLAARLRATGDRREWLRAYFVGKVADIAAMRRGLRARHIQGLELYMVMQCLLPDDRAVSRLFVAKAVLAHLCGRAIAEFPVEPEAEPMPADLARTATYLACLSERLRVWQEAEAAKAAVLAAAEEAERDGSDDDRGAYPAADWVGVNGDADMLAELA